MSEKAVFDWLNNHGGLIPAYDSYHQQVVEMLDEGVASLGEIADIIMLDPGLSIALLRRVNSKLKNNRRSPIATVHTAMGYLGKPAISRLVSSHPTLSDSCADIATINRFRQLLSQNQHALAQLDSFAQIQGINTLDDMRSAILLFNLGEIYTCLFDVDQYKTCQRALLHEPTVEGHVKQIFGFGFDDLGKILAQHWHLPELLGEAFELASNAGRKARLIQLASVIGHEAEKGWYSPSMRSAQKDCADFLNLGTDEIQLQIQSSAIQAARHDALIDVMPAAARLILLPDIDNPIFEKTRPVAKTKPATTTDKRPHKYAEHMKSMLQSPETSQMQVIAALLENLHCGAGYSRVVLMLLNGDRSVLTTRAGRGLDKASPFQKLQIEVARSGIIKLLLQKPQALCINAANYPKYEKALPGNFKATCLCDNFVLMSLFVGKNPTGLIYCDRSASGKTIDQASYTQFKTDIMFTSKALTLIAKRKTGKAA